MLPEDPECPYYLKLMAIRELEEQIARIVKSMNWDKIREEEKRGS